MSKAYTAEKKREAAIIYATYGTYTKVEELMGINCRTVQYWHDNKDKVFCAALTTLRNKADKELVIKYKMIVDKSADHVLNILESYVPSGDIRDTKTLTWNIGLLHDKIQVMEGKSVDLSGHETPKEVLDKIADELERRAVEQLKKSSKKPKLVETTLFTAVE